jgi:hypothetical protein
MSFYDLASGKPFAIWIFVIIASSFYGCKEDPQTNIQGFELDRFEVEEGDGTLPQTFLVRAKGAVEQAISVSFRTQPGTAQTEEDYLSMAGVLEISKDQPENQVMIELVGDTHLELTESFTLIVTFENKDYPFTITIRDDDEIEAIDEDADGFLTPLSLPSMELVWQDEFNEASLSTANWTHELGNGCSIGLCGWGNNELETYSDAPENIRLEDGKLIITARDEGSSFTSARIKTQDKVEVQFGRIDVRAKLPKGQGIWPAIWMLGENITEVGWPACGEIDIMELVGHQPAQTHGTVHYDNNGYQQSTGSTALSSGDFSEKFHVFTIVWDYNVITWYVNNKEFKTFRNTNIASYPFNKPFFFIMNVAVGGNWPGPPDETTIFPQEMRVDYVRVFK